MDLIYNKTGVGYHEVHITDYYIKGDSNQSTAKKILNSAFKKDREIQKKSKTKSIQVKNGLECNCT
ncbi:MAG TPA: hypothetical protein VFK40_00150 [Nitrososphaeraceae archaeon]|nr:hypothetical protein [Nitrososphaeraceae archaeon]